MSQWVWEGRTRAGELRRGVMEAGSERDVQQRLRQQNIMLEKVKQKRKALRMPGFGGRVSAAQLVVFVRQFATMIDAGLPLVQCLDILSSQEPNKFFKSVLLEVKSDVESGLTFADSLKKHPKVFDTLFVNLVAAGEIGGILDTILNRLATYIEKNVKLMRQGKGAMMYPIGILVVAGGVVFALLKWVIPTFAKMFSDMGDAQLPQLQTVIGMSEWFGRNFFCDRRPWAGLVLICSIHQHTQGRYMLDSTLLSYRFLENCCGKSLQNLHEHSGR